MRYNRGAMSTLTPTTRYAPEDVERLSERDGKRYELIDGELREKIVGAKALFIASRICDCLNAAYYPARGFAVVEAMFYCFSRPDHGRKPDVSFVSLQRLPDGKIPDGDIRVAPDLVVEVLSAGNSGVEMEEKLDEYLAAGVPLVWIVNPDRRTIRVYRSDGTTRLFRAADTISGEALLPGFTLQVGDVFPQQ
jgi:Uma2 family endonuclease